MPTHAGAEATAAIAAASAAPVARSAIAYMTGRAAAAAAAATVSERCQYAAEPAFAAAITARPTKTGSRGGRLPRSAGMPTTASTANTTRAGEKYPPCHSASATPQANTPCPSDMRPRPARRYTVGRFIRVGGLFNAVRSSASRRARGCGGGSHGHRARLSDRFADGAGCGLRRGVHAPDVLAQRRAFQQAEPSELRPAQGLGRGTGAAAGGARRAGWDGRRAGPGHGHDPERARLRG